MTEPSIGLLSLLTAIAMEGAKTDAMRQQIVALHNMIDQRFQQLEQQQAQVIRADQVDHA